MKQYKRIYLDGKQGSQLYTVEEIKRFWLNFYGCSFKEYINGIPTNNIFTLDELQSYES